MKNTNENGLPGRATSDHPHGRQLNNLEPYELKIIWYRDGYAEIFKRGYVLCKAVRGRGMVWRAEIGRVKFAGASLQVVFDSIVEWYDKKTYTETSATIDEFSISGGGLCSRCRMDDDARLDEAAASLGMGVRMMPSNRY